MKRIVESVNSPWLRATCDIQEFLEEPYDRIEMIRALAETMVQLQDILWRRALVHTGPGLCPDRTDPAEGRILRVPFAGIRRA